MKMEELRSALRTIGLADPATVLQSGNVIFDSDRAEPKTLAAQIENAIELTFGFRGEVIMRLGSEVDRLVSNHPFTEAQLEHPKMAHVMFLKEAPDPGGFRELRAAHDGVEEITLEGSELYLFYPEGSGHSRLSGANIEKALGTRGTARNWNTVLRIAEVIAD